MKTKQIMLFISAVTMLSAEGTAQTFVPGLLSANPSETNTTITLSWPSFPGKLYDVLSVNELGHPFTNINVNPIQARSTVTPFAYDLTNNAGFYRIRERALVRTNTGPVTSTTIAEMEKIAGLNFTAAQRSQISQFLNSGGDLMTATGYERVRKRGLLNSDPPALVFDPKPPGFTLKQDQQPIQWGPAGNVTLPTNPVDLAFYSVRDLAELIRTRQITSTELTKFYLERLKKYDPRLFCVISLTEDLALKQAQQADEEMAAGKYRGFLHGIPYGLKDLFAVKGYRTTWGAAPFKDQVIDQDATVFKKLTEAGAVLVAKLSLGELASFDTWFGGLTRNPWNEASGSGGSSAGPASATAAGLVAFAIGSETAGSIVQPCTICRLSGLRPTFGRVSRSGAMTLAWSMDKVGPICRTAEDCAIVFDAIRGKDPEDAATVDAAFNLVAERNLSGLRIGYASGVDSTTLNRLRSIVGQTNVVPIKLPSYPNNAMLTILFVEAAAAFDDLSRFGGAEFMVTDMSWIMFHAHTVPAVEYLQANRLREKFIRDMAIVLENVDVYVDDVAADFDAVGANLCGLPCFVIPNGGEKSLVIVGQLYEEGTLLELASAYQKITPFHTQYPPAFRR